MVKATEKQLAINLRRNGLTYSEILKKIIVSKSTLSLWLKDVGLSNPQKQRITEKRMQAQKRGAVAKRQQRLDLIAKIEKDASKDAGHFAEKVFWMVGVALYWAEGNKQKPHDVSCGIKFSNSDPLMVKYFYKWLTNICKISVQDLVFELYVHRGCDIKALKKFWSDKLCLNVDYFEKIRFKPNKFRSYRKNTGEEYRGVVRINVNRSTNLNRKIMAWVKVLCKKFGVE